MEPFFCCSLALKIMGTTPELNCSAEDKSLITSISGVPQQRQNKVDHRKNFGKHQLVSG
jgi:hypothetical protein